MHTVSDLITFHQTFTTNHAELVKFVFGHVEELVNIQREDALPYPALVLEVPDISLIGDPGNLVKHYEYGVAILRDTDYDDFAARRNAWGALEPIAVELINATMQQYPLTQLENFKVAPVEAYSHDNLYGWRITAKIDVPDVLCRT